MIYIGVAITNAALVGGAVYLAVSGHPFLGFFCLLFIQTVKVKP